MSTYQDYAKRLQDILMIQSQPIAARFVKQEDVVSKDYDGQSKLRYCQALYRARRGEKVYVNAENIVCPASAAAFGLKPLPEKLASGEMMSSMGLFYTKEAAARVMSQMPRLPMGEYKGVQVSPLAECDFEPQVIIIESQPEHLMWVALASIFKTGDRLQFDSGIFQATCVDSTLTPFVQNKVNSSLGCYGCREATDLEDGECLIGFPFAKLQEIVENLEMLLQKAIPRVRGKGVFKSTFPAQCGS